MLQDGALHAAIAAHNRAITRIVNALMDLLTQAARSRCTRDGPRGPTRTTGHPRGGAPARRGGAHRSMLDHLIAVETLVITPAPTIGRDAPPRTEKSRP
jgi:hypothetical protein